jgi:hypothetical protein
MLITMILDLLISLVKLATAILDCLTAIENRKAKQQSS